LVVEVNDPLSYDGVPEKLDVIAVWSACGAINYGAAFDGDGRGRLYSDDSYEFPCGNRMRTGYRFFGHRVKLT
jgi:hypothetical protein